MQASSTVVDTLVGAVAVQVAGDGPPVLLVHGIPGSSQVWDDVAQRLVAAGYRALVPDLLGFGASERPAELDRLWIDAQATALAEALVALDVGPVIAVGHDYGAPVCITLAARSPAAVSGLVVAAGNVFTDTPIPAPLLPITWPLIGGIAGRTLLSAPMLAAMLRMGVGRPRHALPRTTYLGDPAQQRSIRTIFTGALRELADRYVNVEAALTDITQPVVVIWGGRDPFFGIEQAHRLVTSLPNATLQLEPTAGHFLPAERPEAFARAVRHLHDRDIPD